MNVLVVGGNRFLGQDLTWRLLAGGHAVTLFNRGRLADPFADRVARIRGDRTTADFGRSLGGRSFDAVVDLALFEGRDAEEAVRILSSRVGHYVMVSTGQVYLVRAGAPSPSREEDYEGPLMPEPEPRSPDHEEWAYGMGKRAAEDVLASAWDAARFPATRLRLPMVSGERDYHRRIEAYVWRLMDGGGVIVPDGGDRRLRHLYGRDVVRTILSMLGCPATFGRAYNLCQEETPTLHALLTLLARLLDAPARLVPVTTDRLVAAGLDPVALSPFSGRWMSFLDATRAKAEIGFRPTPVERYLETIVTCLLAHPPGDRPTGLAQRARERELIAAIRREAPRDAPVPGDTGW
jgi:nucleoside-diphosphate-sugar epimerase